MEAVQLNSVKIEQLRKLFTVVADEKAILTRKAPTGWIETIPSTRLCINFLNYEGCGLLILEDLSIY